MTAPYPYTAVSPVIRDHLAACGFAVAALESGLPLAGIAGSRRAYYRIPGAGLILLVSPHDDADFGRFLRITQFYRLLRVPVPRVHCIDDDAHQVLLEDLGERRLYDVLKSDRTAGLAAYRGALDILVDLQTRCDAFRPECPDVASRVFDRTQLLWETSYYRDNYLVAHRGLARCATDPALQEIFEKLADRVDAGPKAIMHRDYQSQNLMVKPDATVHVIDYQGSRHGSVFYDAASLLLDPYVMLADDEIENLLRHFHAGVMKARTGMLGGAGGSSGWGASAGPLAGYAAFRRSFLEAGLQRVMQAVGAYCFLSRVRGLAEFAGHIPAGEARLAWLIRETGGEWGAVLPGG